MNTLAMLGAQLLAGPNPTLIVGVEDTDDGTATRVYFGHRYKGIYALVTDAAEREKVKRAWGASFMGHLFTETPPADRLFSEAEDGLDPRRIDLRA